MNWTSLILVPAIKSVVIIVALLTGFAYLSYVERKLVARFQVRFGPNQAGPFGLLQPVADGLKAVFKEEFVPGAVDRVVYLIAPALTLVPAIIIWAVIPLSDATFTLFGQTTTLYLVDVNVALLYVLAITSLGTYGIVLAGWSSNNKYSLLGALRTASQLLSYELPMAVAIVSVIVLAGSISIVDIVNAQKGMWFVVLQPVGFIIYFISGLAEANRFPFDLPETENELVSGFATEYGGIKFAVFFMGEYINMITISALATALYLGGWDGPFVDQVPLLGPGYFLLKVAFVVFVIIWIRASLPRLRYDKLMQFCWKFLLPLALVNLAVTAVLVILTSS
jgi:NADH-quinone oxidoreductase subunit H